VPSVNSTSLSRAGDRVEPRGPYLIQRDAAGDVCVSATTDPQVAVIEVVVRGRWSPALRIATWALVNNCFVSHPQAIVVDLQDLADPLGASAAAWWTMSTVGARMRPPVQVVVSLEPTTALAARLNRLGVSRRVPVYATPPLARDAVARQLPPTERTHLRLAPRPDAPGRARVLVTDACRAWRLPTLSDRARLVVSELTDNVLRHAGTEMLIAAARRAAGIQLTVSDDNPLMPAIPSPQPPEAGRGGHGLRAVHATASFWGALPTGPGKVVWATLLPWTAGPPHFDQDPRPGG
jgi:hypothetical protein